mgnify:CR=1 FL=1
MQATTTTLDEFGRVINVTLPTGKTKTVSYEYCKGTGCDATSTAVIKVTTDNPGEPKQTVYLNHFQHPVRTVVEEFSGVNSNSNTDMTYDEQGRVTKTAFTGTGASTESNTSYDDLGRITQVRVSGVGLLGGYTTKYTYGYSENLFTTKVEDPVGNSTTTYSNALGQVVYSKDAMSNVVYHKYDELGRVTDICLVAKVGDACIDRTIENYNAKDERGERIAIDYDGFGYKASQTSNTSGTTHYTYSPLGELLLTVDANGNYVCSEYDFLGRMKRQQVGKGKADGSDYTVTNDSICQLSNPVTDVTEQTFTYDTPYAHCHSYDLDDPTLDNGNNSDANGSKGKLSTISNGGYQKHYCYDSLGRLTETITVIDDERYFTRHKYIENGNDLAGFPEFIKYPSGFEIGYTYKENGYHESIYNETTLWQANEMNGFGRVTNETFSDGSIITNDYDEVYSRLTSQALEGESTPIMAYGSYDALGNVESITRGSNPATTYDYDSLYRLETASGVSIKYNQHGNITEKDGKTLTYISDLERNFDPLLTTYHDLFCGNDNNKPPNAVIRQGNDSKTYDKHNDVLYCYDASGNMKKSGTFDTELNITYNHDNKPTEIKKGSAVITFAYDPLGRRYKQVAGDTTTYYLGNGYEVVTNSDGTYQQHYIGGVALVSTMPESSSGVTHNPADSTLLKDRLGSTIKKGDEDITYDPWGCHDQIDGCTTQPATE